MRFPKEAGIERLAPHDLRRTCARLCHGAGRELERCKMPPKIGDNKGTITVPCNSFRCLWVLSAPCKLLRFRILLHSVPKGHSLTETGADSQSSILASTSSPAFNFRAARHPSSCRLI